MKGDSRRIEEAQREDLGIHQRSLHLQKAPKTSLAACRTHAFLLLPLTATRCSSRRPSSSKWGNFCDFSEKRQQQKGDWRFRELPRQRCSKRQARNKQQGSVASSSKRAFNFLFLLLPSRVPLTEAQFLSLLAKSKGFLGAKSKREIQIAAAVGAAWLAT